MARAWFKNYRGLRDVELSMTPLTVLVGPNGSGKSSILAGLAPVHAVLPDDAWRQDASLHVVREVQLDDGSSMRIESQAHGTSLVTHPYRHTLLRLELASLRARSSVTAAPTLAGNGENLVNLFATLDLATQLDVSRALRQHVPLFDGVQVRPARDVGQLELVFADRWAPHVKYTVHQVSDGTLLVLAYLLVAHQETPPHVLCIEEPERGLHPYLIGEIVKVLRAVATGAGGRPAMQIVVATQSPELVEHARPEEVRFLRRSEEDGSVQIESVPTDREDWPSVFRAYDESLGGMWLAGGLGGVPAGGA